MTDVCSDREPTMEIIPNGRELVVAINLDQGGTLLLGDRTEQILRIANNILAADCAWMPGELVRLARDIVEFKVTKVLPIEADPRSLDVEIKSEAEFEQAKKAREAMKQFSSFLRAIFKDAFARLEQQARDWNEGRGRLAKIQ
jgi:hypothetical protein